MSLGAGGDSSEASRLLEAALLQMDGIIQGTKMTTTAGTGGFNSSDFSPETNPRSTRQQPLPPTATAPKNNRESSLSAYENGGKAAGPSYLSEALANLHEAVVKSGAGG